MPQAKAGGREMKKSLPQSNALHLTALPSRGTRFCVRLGAPNKIDRFAHKCSLFPPPAAVTFVARQRGHKRRAIRESPLQHFRTHQLFIIHYSFFIIHLFSGRRVVAPYARISVRRSVNNPQHKFVIRNEAKDLKQHKIKIYATIFFAYRRRRTNGRARPLQKILPQLL